MKEPLLQKQRGSPFWYAEIEMWDVQKGVFKRKFKTTKVRLDGGAEGEDKAMQIAREMARVARAAYEGATRGWSVEGTGKLVNGILAAAGLPTGMVERPSWRDYLETWWASTGVTISASSRPVVQGQLKAFDTWLGKRAAMPLDLLTGADMQAFWAWLCSRYSGSTPKITLASVARVMRRAHNEGVIKSNPAALVEKGGRVNTSAEREPFTADEIRRMLETAEGWKRAGGREWVTMILLGLCTGARLSDCRVMGEGNVVRTDGGLLLRFEPKKGRRTKQVVTVPVVQPLLSHLKTLLPGLAPGAPFCPRVMAIKERSDVSRAFVDLLEAAGIGESVVVEGRGKKFRAKSFHSLRHTLPTLLAAAGVPEEVRMKITGHTSKAVARGYTHEEMARIEALLSHGLAAFTGTKKPAGTGSGRAGRKSAVKRRQ